MSYSEKQALREEYGARILALALGGALKGRLEAINKAADATAVEKALVKFAWEGYKAAIKAVID